MAAERQQHLFECATVCGYLLDRIDASCDLEIRQSSIPGAGSALFTKTQIGEGEQIFQSSPLVSVVLDKAQNVCSYCFKDGDSRLHASGRFRSKNDPVEVFQACKKCGDLRYCSQLCHETSEGTYHQHEWTFSEAPAMLPKVRALYRILQQRSHHLISDQLWQAVQKMEAHYEARMSTTAANAIRDVATVAKAKTGSYESVETISRLYCVLLTNNICIREAGQSKVLGTALDIVMSLMNHSCSPNVITIFDGNLLCVRSLRPIQAGEELLQCYTDDTCDVLMRRKKLLEQYHFLCECNRCLQEFELHKSLVAGDMDRIDHIQRTQEEVTELINNSLLKFTSSSDHRATALSTLESQALSLTAAAFPDSRWPRELDPLPTLYKRLAVMSSMLGQSFTALRYSLKGCSYTQLKFGPDWASDLLDLVKLLVPVASNARSLGAQMPIQPAELWVGFIGYLQILAAHARKLYGERATFTQAVDGWLREIVANPRMLATVGFKRKFQTAHFKLLEWASVEDHLTAWAL